jgi:hypothetical protein
VRFRAAVAPKFAGNGDPEDALFAPVAAPQVDEMRLPKMRLPECIGERAVGVVFEAVGEQAHSALSGSCAAKRAKRSRRSKSMYGQLRRE